MAYATRENIEETYGEQITQMVIDHGLNAIEEAEDELQELNDAGASAEDIAAAEAILASAVANLDANTEATITRNLNSAADTIDSYIVSRYPQEWVTPPGLLRTLNETIAVYWMSLSADWRTDEMKERYNEAIKTLQGIRDAKIDLTGGVAVEVEIPATPSTGLITMSRWNRQ